MSRTTAVVAACSIAALLGACAESTDSASAPAPAAEPATSATPETEPMTANTSADPAYVLGHTVTRIDGTAEPLSAYEGKVLLIVNTASKCGFTPQYEGLQNLYSEKKDAGLVVLGFPSDNFGGQEFDTNAEVVQFCESNYGVEFPMFEKVDVKGGDASPLFRQLAEQADGEPKWNFTKYLVGRDGKVVAKFDSGVRPDGEELTARVDELLQG